MQVEIEIDTAKKLNDVANALGMDSKELVNRALLLYIDNISRYADLKKEMKAWDFLSDEALKNFEKTL
ncbi:MAG TPA: hypothetical protein VI934_05040 [Candidatus Nanoarchaeia archaeon]|nr:hypothetical protein [Candidatus Nanoarchaeia archaeon]